MNERPRAVNCSRDYVVIANSFALVIIPFFALIILNACIYRTINRATRLHNAISSNQRRDHKVYMDMEVANRQSPCHVVLHLATLALNICCYCPCPPCCTRSP